MAIINILDHQTIDKIAAGEVVERPASVVKELVENAVDAGAGAVTVEIKDGGTSLIRVTDNGCGIEKEQIQNAFLRHATSKITSANDLTELASLGFRGEALASIAAVSRVEMISKTASELTGIRYVIEGGVEREREEIGAPEGTTVLVRSLFYNTPPRRKFLKQPQTEGSYVAELMEHLAMSNPHISFQFIANGQTRFYTTGNGDLKEIVYRIYGRDISGQLIPFSYETEGMSIDGLLGKPLISRANRNYEIFYINGRYIKSGLIGKAVEEGYREYLMQHKFPFCVLHFRIDAQRIDVNVHPTKMEVRIADAPAFCDTVREAVRGALHGTEMIPEIALTKDRDKRNGAAPAAGGKAAPEPFESRRLLAEAAARRSAPTRQTDDEAGHTPTAASEGTAYEPARDPAETLLVRDSAGYGAKSGVPGSMPEQTATAARTPERTSFVQAELFENRILSAQSRPSFRIIGQLFETYWLVAYEDKLLIIDQHAAHEKVKYERLMRRFRERTIVSQALDPPMIVTLNGRERECYIKHAEDFEALGFVIEEFGGSDYAVRSVPMDLYGYGERELFREILEELTEETAAGTPESIRIRIASMACKAAVKGNMRLSADEAEKLIDELLTLENPYHCPHGRPTIISMTKYELEKKFKRIVT